MEKNIESGKPSTLELAHVKLFRIFVEIIGSWPHKELGTKKLSVFFPSHSFLFLVSAVKLCAELMYLKSSFGVKSFEMLGHVYVTVLVNVTAVTRIILPWQKKYRNLLKDFFEEFHLFHHKNKSEYSAKIQEKVANACIFFFKFLSLEVICGLITFNLAPCFNNYRSGMYSADKPINGTYELSVYYAFPFDYSTNFNWYITLSFFNIFLAAVSSFILCFYDLILTFAAVHIWGHMKILVEDLKKIPRPQMNNFKSGKNLAVVMYTEEESKHVKRLLTNIIEHHKMITCFSNRTSEVFGPMLFFYYLILQVSGCIVLFQLSTLDPEAIAKYGMVAVILFQELIQLSIVFESIKSVSDSIIDETYGLPWECMDVKNRKIVLFFLQNVQVPANVKAMGLVAVGVESMASVLKTSISYCVMLRTFAYE